MSKRKCSVSLCGQGSTRKSLYYYPSSANRRMPLVMCPTRRQLPLSHSCLHNLLRYYLSLKLYEGQRYVCPVGRGKRETDICARIRASKRLGAHVEGHRNRWWHITRSLQGGVQEAHTWAPRAASPTHCVCRVGTGSLEKCIVIGYWQEGILRKRFNGRTIRFFLNLAEDLLFENERGRYLSETKRKKTLRPKMNTPMRIHPRRAYLPWILRINYI